MQSQRPTRKVADREALRIKGQFWTPDWVAEAMAAFVLAGDADEIFDPAVGAGALLHAAKNVAAKMGKQILLSGREIDPDALMQARQSGLTDDDLARVEVRDFALHPPGRRLKAIIANPPYIRHHRLSSDVKAALKTYSAALLGKSLDGRAGLHVYFLIRALDLLDDNGRLAFIMPADTCEGVFAQPLWQWITGRFRLEAVLTFGAEASPFPAVDTNPIIFFIQNVKPQTDFVWATCEQADNRDLEAWAHSGFDQSPRTGLIAERREIAEALDTGLSRPPTSIQADGPTLGDYARVMRGIATGANEFFFLTVEQAQTLKLPDEFLIPAIGRTRDVTTDEVSCETLRLLAENGRPTRLFAPDGRVMDSFPQTMRDYLKQGEAMGIHERTLIATRRPWYKMESRTPPPFLFAYLGRRRARFIRNRAGVLPLTGFLCVYPRSDDPVFIDKLWQVFQHPATIANLPLVGKSYGSGAIKVEPRALEKLPLPVAVVEATKLSLKAKSNRTSLE
jgi:adenine-specific DNA-methyltransferase